MGPSIVYTSSEEYKSSGFKKDNIYVLQDAQRILLNNKDVFEAAKFLDEEPEIPEPGKLYVIDGKNLIAYNGNQKVDLTSVIVAAVAESIDNIDHSVFITEDGLIQAIEDFVKQEEMNAYLKSADAETIYATKEALDDAVEGVVKTADIADVVRQDDIANVARKSDLTPLATSEEVSELSDAVDAKLADKADVSVLEDYATKVYVDEKVAAIVPDVTQEELDAVEESIPESAIAAIFAQAKEAGYKGTKATLIAQLAEVLNVADNIVIKEGDVVESVTVDGVVYDNIGEAIAHVSNGGTITAVKNTATDGVTIAQTMTLDMDNKILAAENKTIAVTAGDFTVKNANLVNNETPATSAINPMFTVASGSSLTLKDSVIDTKSAVAISAKGDVTLDGVEINSSTPAASAASGYDAKVLVSVSPDATLTMKSGSINATTSSDSECGLYGIMMSSGGKVVLGDSQTGEGPTIITNSAPIGSNNLDMGPDEITIYGGYYKSLMTHAGFQGVMYLGASATVKIHGGTFDGGLYDIAIPYRPAVYNIEITGGTFLAPETIKKDFKNGGHGPDTDNTQDSIVISGGNFTSEVPAEYLADGKVCVQHDDGRWYVEAAA